MSYHDASQFPGSMGPMSPQFEFAPPEMHAEAPHAAARSARNVRERKQETLIFHGEALARDRWGEQFGPWIVLGFTASFALLLMAMVIIGQLPGQSFALKSLSDIFQFAGECIGLYFCARITLRLRHVSSRLSREVLQKGAERRSANEMAIAHSEAQTARRAFFAWAAITIAVALYASGQAIWTSFDVRMPSADVPTPGLYDLGFAPSYIFFLLGTLLLTRRNKASVGRVRLLLDSLAVIGAALAISWFFLLGPSIAGLGQVSTPLAIRSIYYPTSDLFLIAIGAFLMFSPLANRAQQPVFMLLCMGLFFLAITDSLVGYYSLSNNFNTGTIQDVLWPLSLSLIGLAAIEYPRSIAREQEQAERAKNAHMLSTPSHAPGRLAQLSLTAQTIAPFILVLATCALLLTQVAPRGGAVLLQADLVALALILIVIARQALTLLENNRLTMQMRGELVISRRELQATRREADEASRSAQEKHILEEGVAALREVHARVARGDISARAPGIAGPLLPIAISLNLMLDRLGALSIRGAKYDQLTAECAQLQEAIERLGQGNAPWPPEQQMPQGAAEIRSVFLGLAHLYRIQDGQRRRQITALESMRNLMRRVHDSLNEIRYSRAFNELPQTGFERITLERLLREVTLLEQQQQGVLDRLLPEEQNALTVQRDDLVDRLIPPQDYQFRQVQSQVKNHPQLYNDPYMQHGVQSHSVYTVPME